MMVRGWYLVLFPAMGAKWLLWDLLVCWDIKVISPKSLASDPTQSPPTQYLPFPQFCHVWNQLHHLSPNLSCWWGRLRQIYDICSEGGFNRFIDSSYFQQNVFNPDLKPQGWNGNNMFVEWHCLKPWLWNYISQAKYVTIFWGKIGALVTRDR